MAARKSAKKAAAKRAGSVVKAPKTAAGSAKKAAAKKAAAKKAAAKKAATKKATAKKAAGSAMAKLASAKSMPRAGRDPKGGLTALGRAWYNQREGSHLRPGVKGPADTPEKMRRKGSFLTRHFTHPRGPMTDKNGRPTRLALSAHAWGEPVPKSMADAHALAAEGRRLLERYHAVKEPKKRRAGR